MNQVARVFVIINLLLSAGFLLAAATFLQQSTDWKAKEMTARNEMSNLEQEKAREISELNAEIQRLNQAKQMLTDKVSAKENEITDLKARRDALQEQKNGAERAAQQLRGDVTKLTGQVEELRGIYSQLHDLIERYRTRAEEAQKAAAQAQQKQAELAKLADERAGEIHNLKTTLESIQQTLSRTEAKLATYVAIYPPPAEAVQPKIDGFVVRFDGATQLVEINRGSKHGVKIGHVFDLVRGNSQYICTVRADRVGPDSCVCSIEIKTGRWPQAGDLATKLSAVPTKN
ncbi:MAG TPA: hypothetical protein ENK43_02690 [Planctomycetes bacterium]|nr:hypothetical protein [Planctomycetota bacterium]